LAVTTETSFGVATPATAAAAPGVEAELEELPPPQPARIAVAVMARSSNRALLVMKRSPDRKWFDCG